MDDICRLCCSTKFVSNNIFDEEGALYLKMSLYLPIKVFKNDGLPHKVCDKCSCKVNDLYQFCNETIEVQARLRAILMSNTFTPDIVDLTRVKRCSSPVPDHKQREQSTQTDWNTVKPTWNADKPTWNTDKSGDHIQTPPTDIQIKQECVNIPNEDTPLSPVKEETYDDGGVSDNSDNISLLKLKKKKSDKSELNGVKKKGRKKKEKLKDWDMLMNVLPETSLGNGHLDESYKDIDVKVKGEIQEQEELHCCICFEKHYSQYDLLQHYNKHAVEPTSSKPPILPPLPEKEPYRCIRCDKTVSAEEWSSHWVRHWRIDTRPYRCGVCDKSFRSPRQILKHGLTHRSVETQLRVRKPFACELCGDTLASLRSLAAHRVRSHPESAARPLLLSCAECGRRFAHANSLRRHLRAHSGERNFLCNVCGKALSSREHLKFHIRIHTGDKRNVCGVCGKGFVKKSNLTLHERVHSGEKPHVCSHCGKAFSQRSTLVIHERYHSGARPYQCSLCGRGFVAKGLLTMHLKSTCI